MSFFFFFNDTATTEIYTLSLHDALPICWAAASSTTGRGASTAWPTPTSTCWSRTARAPTSAATCCPSGPAWTCARSEEHTSELQSRQYLVCRLLLEKKKKKHKTHNNLIY